MNDTYHQLAERFSMTGMPLTPALVDIVKETFTREEASVAAHLTPWPVPLTTQTLESIADKSGLDAETVGSVLESLAGKKLIFSQRNDAGQTTYGFHHAGFGFPQSYFWDGGDSKFAQKMTKLVSAYFKRDVTQKAFGGTPTKPYRYIPIGRSIEPDVQAVLPHDRMETVLAQASEFAVVHCPCRVQAKLWGRGCDHSLEVCLKFDEMAQYVIDRELGRRISREQAQQIIDDAAKEGLVHFVDNAQGGIKHNCNCCGCACWNVGLIRRKKIARDDLMAVYFIRHTDEDVCAGCGECIDVCPVAAVEIEDGLACVYTAWCIGCGVCVQKCDLDAIEIRYRQDMPKVPAGFEALYRQINKEKDSLR